MVHCHALSRREHPPISGLIDGLLASQHLCRQGRPFDLLTWLILTFGLFIAHGTNKLINDNTDLVRGIDKVKTIGRSTACFR